MEKIDNSSFAITPRHYPEQGDESIDFSKAVVEEVYYYITALSNIIESTSTIGSMIIFPVIASVGTCHMISLIYVVKFLQSFDYLALINCEMPSNLSLFMRFFDRNVYDLMPKIVEDNIPNCNLDLLLTQAGLDCMIIRAIFPVMVPIFTVVCLKVLLILSTNSFGKKSCFGRVLGKFNSLIGVNVLVWVLLTNQVELMINFWPFVYSLGYVSATNYIGDVIGITIFICFIVIFIYFSWKAHHLRTDNPEANRSFLSQFKSKPRESAYYFCLGVLQDLLVPPCMIFFIDSPLIQMSSLTFFAALKLCFLIGMRPFKKSSSNSIEVLNNGVIGTILGLMFILEIAKDDISEEVKYNVIGYPCIFLILSVLLLNLGLPSIDFLFEALSGCLRSTAKVDQSSPPLPNKLSFEEERSPLPTLKIEIGGHPLAKIRGKKKSSLGESKVELGVLKDEGRREIN